MNNDWLMHYNHNHDKLGRFSESSGGSGSSRSGKHKTAPNGKGSAMSAKDRLKRDRGRWYFDADSNGNITRWYDSEGKDYTKDEIYEHVKSRGRKALAATLALYGSAALLYYASTM